MVVLEVGRFLVSRAPFFRLLTHATAVVRGDQDGEGEVRLSVSESKV